MHIGPGGRLRRDENRPVWEKDIGGGRVEEGK